MSYRVTLLPLLLLCFVATAAFGASESSPAFVRVVVSPPPEGNAPLTLLLDSDEALCKKAYGEEWAGRCFVAPGREGEIVRGAHISPDVPGEWRWDDGRTLSFRPKKPWPAGRNFEVSLGGVPLPSRVKLSSSRVSFATPPLALLSLNADVWIDPDPGGERAVTFDMRFTTPPDRALVERDMRLEVSDPALKLGRPEFVWGEDGNCLVRARVPALGSMPAVTAFSLPGVAGEVRAKGSRWVIPKGRETARAQVTVPGSTTIFCVKKASLESSRDERLAGEYRLNLETSLLVRPDELMRSMKALRLPRALNENAVSATVWTAAPVIDEETLARAVPVALEPLQQADVPSGKISFRVKAEPESYLLFYLPQGFGPSREYALSSPWHEVFHAAPFRPELDFLQPGNVLALGGSRRLDVHSSGLTAIRWRASRVLDSYLGLAAAQPAPFTAAGIPFDVLSDSASGEISLQRTEPGVPQFSSLDATPMFRNGRGLAYIELTGMDGDREVASASRFLLLTDMGLIVKKGAAGGRDVFVCSLSGGSPVSGAVVRIVGVNGLPVAEAVTDVEGRAVLPSVSGLERERRPIAITAWKKSAGGEDMAWLPLADESRVVDLSRFSTQGQTSEADGVNAYVFSQRGMFRPGETLRFGVLVRRGDWKALPADMPLFVELVDPSERTMFRRLFKVGADGMAEVSWQAPESAATGRYRLDVRTPDAHGMDVVLGSVAVRLEEFQPDSMALSLSLQPAPGRGWLEASSASAAVTLRNLFGMPAADRRVRAQLSVWPTALSFPGYEDFSFHDAMPYKGSPLTLELGETRTDAEGRAVLPLPLDKLRGGTLRCRLLVEGFEPGGGRAVTEEKEFLVSPLGCVLGFRPTGAAGNLDFIPEGGEAALEFVALGPDLAPADPGEVSFRVSARRYVTSLVTDRDGRYRYEDTPVDSVIAESRAAFGRDGRARWSVPTGTCGEFLLEVRNSRGLVMASVPFTVAGNADLRLAGLSALPSGSLRMHLENTSGASGGRLRAFISSPYEGAGLITLERDSVAAWRWFRAPAGDSVQEIEIPRDFEGRGYVSVSLVRSLSSPDAFMNPYVFAVSPVSVNVERRDMRLRVETPREPVLPGSSIPVTVESGRAGRALLFAVDEGVLRLTAFPTPDPLRYLLNDRALEVETRQMFDLLMPDHGTFRMPAFGGDMGMAGSRFHNPFKRRNEPPVSWWSGLVDLAAGTNRFDIPVPGYYSGTVRVMAVAASPDAAGSASAEATVRGPVVVTPQLPAQASPGDRFEGAVAVANNGDGPLHATLSVKSDDALRLIDAPPSEITVAAGAETVLPFRVEVADRPGGAEIAFTVAADGVNVTRSGSLSVRPASALRASAKVGVATSSTTLSTGRTLYPYGAEGSASVSALPLPALRGLVRYLDAYPYPCVEQRISRAMPYALFLKRSALFAESGNADEARRTARERVDDALRAVESSLSWRGVSLWPGEEPDLLVTAYAADFLLTLQECGLSVPGGMHTSVFNALERAADKVPASLEESRELAYALWVLTREGRITTQALEQLLLRLEDFPGWQQDVTSSLIAASGAVMRMKDAVLPLLDLYRKPGAEFRATRLDALAALSLRASVLARHFPDRLDKAREEIVEELFDATNGGRYVTLSAALAVRALFDMEKAAPVPEGVSLRCAEVQPGFAPGDGQPQTLENMLTLSAPGCASYALDVPAGGQPLYWEVSDAGFDRKAPEGALSEGMEVTRTYLDAEGLPATKIRQGDLLTVNVTARSYGGPLKDAVIVDLLPGGFEMDLSSPVSASDASSEGLIVDRREDRMILFAPLESEPSVFTYRIRAVSRGTFTLPPVQAEDMYRRDVRAFSSGGSVSVE